MYWNCATSLMSSDFVSRRSCRRPLPGKQPDVVATGTARLGVFLSLKLSPRMLSTWLWCSSRSSTAEAMTVSPSSSPHSPKPLLEVRMMQPRS